MAGKLTPRQAAFVNEYLVDLNAAAAARRAGYSEKTADRIGHQNLRKLEIAQAIQEAQEARAERLEITADRVAEEIAKLAFSNMLDYMTVTHDGYAVVDLSALTREQAAAITELQVEEYVEGRDDDTRLVKRVKFKLSDKRGALELLGKHLGMFTDRVELSGEVKSAEPVTPPERALSAAATALRRNGVTN
ncbi:MAG: terminase small subunit [Trueperaceae bacterium]